MLSNREKFGCIKKIKKGFSNLPFLLFTAMNRYFFNNFAFFPRIVFGTAKRRITQEDVSHRSIILHELLSRALLDDVG